ncbi:hypothetical protein V8E54_012150 [Elaphomyces granulatus]
MPARHLRSSQTRQKRRQEATPQDTQQNKRQRLSVVVELPDNDCTGPDLEPVLPSNEAVIKNEVYGENLNYENETGQVDLPPRSTLDPVLPRSSIDLTEVDKGRVSYSNAQSSLVSTPSDTPNDTDALNANENGVPGLSLWYSVTRRPQFQSTSENRELVRRVKFMLWARIFSGQASKQARSVLWPDMHNEMGLSRLIGDIWREQRLLMLQNDTNQEYHPSEQPVPEEARKLRDSFGEWRSHILQKVRDAVATHYDFCAPGVDGSELAGKLLEDDNFICKNYLEPEKLRFYADIIMITVARIFYGVPGSSYGIARYHATSKYFTSLPAIAVIIACTQIYHAISEWTTGHRKTKRVDNEVIEVIYRRLYAAWYAQHADRQAKLSEMQLRQIKARAGVDLKQPSCPQSDSIPPCKYTKYRNSLDDLQEEEEEAEARKH